MFLLARGVARRFYIDGQESAVINADKGSIRDSVGSHKQRAGAGAVPHTELPHSLGSFSEGSGLSYTAEVGIWAPA